MERPVENKLKTMIDRSGNSDVDVTVNIDIDTKAIAYGMLCSLYAKGDLTEQELARAIQKLDNLIERDRNKRREKSNIDSRPKLFHFPQPTKGRKWI